ncbi:type II toxin-antitoxin system PemK/MazF family toxin [Rhodopseudomonas boonkerdii]|nr:type II toxin-antitoxin system PemK/MazF family toxin [Rhodopseudomonas boonkerdii]UGV27935.1 type II toxin-antitoxin system PemK/MazF family toxin [Rhodopseudomonas boonkerdii]
MRRGDLVTVVMQGAYGKPRPAVVVQALGHEGLTSVTFLPLTTEVTAAEIIRVLVEPSADNGLEAKSQVMADKCTTLPRSKIGKVFGRLDDADMDRVNRALAVFLGFA